MMNTRYRSWADRDGLVRVIITHIIINNIYIITYNMYDRCK